MLERMRIADDLVTELLLPCPGRGGRGDIDEPLLNQSSTVSGGH